MDPAQVSVERRKGKIVFTVSARGGSGSTASTTCPYQGAEHRRPRRAESDPSDEGCARAERGNPDRVDRALPEQRAAERDPEHGPPRQRRPGRCDRQEQWNGEARWRERWGGLPWSAARSISRRSGCPPTTRSSSRPGRLTATEIARAFRIPPWMIAAGGRELADVLERREPDADFVMLSLRPWLTVIEQALAADRDLFSASLFLEFLMDGLLRADSKTRAEIYTQALDPLTGWMRRDEVETPREPRNRIRSRSRHLGGIGATDERSRRMSKINKAPEQRTIDVDVESLDTRGRTVHGYAAVYGAVSAGPRRVPGDDRTRSVPERARRRRPRAPESRPERGARAGRSPARSACSTRSAVCASSSTSPTRRWGRTSARRSERGDLDGASFRFVVGDESWKATFAPSPPWRSCTTSRSRRIRPTRPHRSSSEHDPTRRNKMDEVKTLEPQPDEDEERDDDRTSVSCD